MHRNQITFLLGNYAERYPDEQDTVNRFQAFVEGHDDCFHRSQLSGHVTGSAWVVNRAASHVLLTHHKKLDLWVQLGGHADGQSNVQQVALREAVEESGIAQLESIGDELFDIDIHSIPARGDEPQHLHYDARFAFRSTHSDEFSLSDESHALEWVAIDKLHLKTSEASMQRMAEKWLSAAD